jgi:hypothetical protein
LVGLRRKLWGGELWSAEGREEWSDCWSEIKGTPVAKPTTAEGSKAEVELDDEAIKFPRRVVSDLMADTFTTLFYGCMIVG